MLGPVRGVKRNKFPEPVVCGLVLMTVMPQKGHGKRRQREREFEYTEAQGGSQGLGQSQGNDADHFRTGGKKRDGYQVRDNQANFSSATDLFDGVTQQTRTLLAIVDPDMRGRKKLTKANLFASQRVAFANDAHKTLLPQRSSGEPGSWRERQREKTQCEITMVELCDGQIENALEPLYLKGEVGSVTFHRAQQIRQDCGFGVIRCGDAIANIGGGGIEGRLVVNRFSDDI